MGTGATFGALPSFGSPNGSTWPQHAYRNLHDHAPVRHWAMAPSPREKEQASVFFSQAGQTRPRWRCWGRRLSRTPSRALGTAVVLALLVSGLLVRYLWGGAGFGLQREYETGLPTGAPSRLGQPVISIPAALSSANAAAESGLAVPDVPSRRPDSGPLDQPELELPATGAAAAATLEPASTWATPADSLGHGADPRTVLTPHTPEQTQAAADTDERQMWVSAGPAVAETGATQVGSTAAAEAAVLPAAGVYGADGSLREAPSAPNLGGVTGLLDDPERIVDAIMSRAFQSTLPSQYSTLGCPAINETRYSDLQAPSPSPSSSFPSSPGGRLFFFALDLRSVVELLPQLLGSVLAAIEFIGPHACALSIVEGNSHDRTGAVLEALRPRLQALGVAFDLQHSDIDPTHGGRIGKLARLRNLALEPMLRDGGLYDPERATVLFVNDVAACAEDVLELAYQRRRLGAHMACATDWIDSPNGPDGITFYDTWIMRTINGGSIHPIPTVQGQPWLQAGYEFWTDLAGRARWKERRPVQVFACWNGAVAVAARPFLQREVRFRSASTEAGRQECETGEPTLLGKDLWRMGYGRIAVVPSVSLGYNHFIGSKVKDIRGFVSHWVEREHLAGVAAEIDWIEQPPELVLCMPDFSQQSWRPWNEGFEGGEGGAGATAAGVAADGAAALETGGGL